MIELKRVLVAVDFSEFSNHAVRYGCELANQFNAELFLLHVILTPMVVDEGMDFLVRVWDENQDDLRSAAMNKMQELDVAPLPEDKVTIDTRMGAPFSEIIQFAEAKDIDLIVLGTHGRTGLRNLIMGSVAERVVSKSPCPVLTVRPEYNSALGESGGSSFTGRGKRAEMAQP